MPSTFDFDEFSWAIGLYEGEGYVGVERKGNCRMTVTSSDIDVLNRFMSIVSYGQINAWSGNQNKKRLGNKAIWVWRLSKQSEIKVLLERMMPYLSHRRLQQAEKVITYISQERQLAHGRRKLTDNEVRAIRQQYSSGNVSLQMLAEKYRSFDI